MTKSQDIKYTSKTSQLYEPITLQNETDLKSILESAEPLYEYRTIVALKKKPKKAAISFTSTPNFTHLTM